MKLPLMFVLAATQRRGDVRNGSRDRHRPRKRR
jgi:hypothetical protein